MRLRTPLRLRMKPLASLALTRGRDDATFDWTPAIARRSSILWPAQTCRPRRSIHCEHARGLEDIPDTRRVIVKALRQLIEPAWARQVDVNNLNNATWTRPHHDYAVRQQNSFRNTVRDM